VQSTRVPGTLTVSPEHSLGRPSGHIEANRGDPNMRNQTVVHLSVEGDAEITQKGGLDMKFPKPNPQLEPEADRTSWPANGMAD